MSQDVWSAAFDSPINCGFTIAITAVATAAFLGIAARRGVLARLALVAPGMLTAIGVLGTFVGILVGLLQFDVADISGSVPGLLRGMKTAFVTSVMGTGAGLAVKLLAALSSKPDDTAEPKGVEDVVALLNGIKQETVTGRKELIGAFERMRAALSGDSESSLVTQIQRLRADVTDEMKAGRRANEEKIALIADEIRKISTKLAEDTTQAFVQALEHAIRDFNQRITEQFGENFAHLNVAVGRLLDWQENYREQMQANAEALREGAAGIQAARGGMEAIASKADALVGAATAMQRLLDGLAKTQSELDARLEAFSGMAAAAQAAMPTIQRQVEELTKGFAREVEKALVQGQQASREMQASTLAHEVALKDGSARFALVVGDAAAKAQDAATAAVRDLERTMQAAATEAAGVQAAQKKSFETIAASCEGLRADTAAAGQTVQNAIKEVGSALQRTIVESSDAARKEATETARRVAEQLQRTTDEEFKRIADSLDKQIKQLDKALERELTNSIAALGSQLTSLSRQFVDDYTPLTARLREVLELARRVPA